MKVYLKEETPTPGPPIEEIIACLTPRISEKSLTPRLACFTGEGEGEGTPKPTEELLECIIPRLSCIMDVMGGGIGGGLGSSLLG